MLDIVDKDSVQTGQVGLLPLGFVALPVVGGHIALADVQAPVVHHEDFGVQTLARGFYLSKKFRQRGAEDGAKHGLIGRPGFAPPLAVKTVDIGLRQGGVLAGLGIDGLNYGRLAEPFLDPRDLVLNQAFVFRCTGAGRQHPKRHSAENECFLEHGLTLLNSTNSAKCMSLVNGRDSWNETQRWPSRLSAGQAISAAGLKNV